MIWIDSNPVLENRVLDKIFTPEEFMFYDKDGFELCKAEQEFYLANNIKLNDCLNHICCQQDWFTVEGKDVFVDHALILHRFSYGAEARDQLQLIAHSHGIPQAGWLLQTRQKWGFDVAIDAVDDIGEMYEVIHIEFDSYFHDDFLEKMYHIKEQVERTDWEKAALQIRKHTDKWQYLHGFHQNHWKAKYLFGWNKAEYTEKAA